MAGLCEGGNEPTGSLKASKNIREGGDFNGAHRNVAILSRRIREHHFFIDINPSTPQTDQPAAAHALAVVDDHPTNTEISCG
ncbi:hypothetical protein ANN_00069 [Periplaneta americana]|uniref:Uncharacterized protein n=1 Tax=Periplaneta americana TaxID=6978 RepID=A0ABQ8TQ17_PERAM|nr:hypothetical protein ANN_00069 [Periplaneta americana]